MDGLDLTVAFRSLVSSFSSGVDANLITLLGVGVVFVASAIYFESARARQQSQLESDQLHRIGLPEEFQRIEADRKAEAGRVGFRCFEPNQRYKIVSVFAVMVMVGIMAGVASSINWHAASSDAAGSVSSPSGASGSVSSRAGSVASSSASVAVASVQDHPRVTQILSAAPGKPVQLRATNIGEVSDDAPLNATELASRMRISIQGLPCELTEAQRAAEDEGALDLQCTLDLEQVRRRLLPASNGTGAGPHEMIVRIESDHCVVKDAPPGACDNLQVLGSSSTFDVTFPVDAPRIIPPPTQPPLDLIFAAYVFVHGPNDRFQVAMTMLRSLAPVPFENIYIFLQLDETYELRRHELDELVRAQWPNVKTFQHEKYRWVQQADWREFMTTITSVAEDRLFWFTQNDDHIYVDFNTDMLMEGIDLMLHAEGNTKKLKTMYLSHHPEIILLSRKLIPKQPVERIGRSFTRFNTTLLDAVQIVNKAWLQYIFLEFVWPPAGDRVDWRRIDGLIMDPAVWGGVNLPALDTEHFLQTLYVPMRELLRKAIAYPHVHMDASCIAPIPFPDLCATQVPHPVRFDTDGILRQIDPQKCPTPWHPPGFAWPGGQRERETRGEGEGRDGEEARWRSSSSSLLACARSSVLCRSRLDHRCSR